MSDHSTVLWRVETRGPDGHVKIRMIEARYCIPNGEIVTFHAGNYPVLILSNRDIIQIERIGPRVARRAGR